MEPRPDVWRTRFDDHATRIATSLPGARIEHIGSTAIGGMVSKDVVDLLVGIEPDAYDEAFAALTEAGYTVEGRRDRHAWLCWPDPSHRQVIIHLVNPDGVEWDRRLRFRDVLRSDTALAERYQDLKRTIASSTDDWTEYTARKASFVRDVLAG